MSPTAIPYPHAIRNVVQNPLVDPPSSESDPLFDDDVHVEFDDTLDGDVDPYVDSPVGEGPRIATDRLLDDTHPLVEWPVGYINDILALSGHEIQQLVDKERDDYTNPWKGSIKLLVHPMTDAEAKLGPLFDG